ncbi:hypothetical protein FOA52_012963 [Chlamydomonas sp. UWO 241]|nr:hypothetical protein FOA52_012963 [Chlamydomonas sp. UWO 241]
MSSAGTWQEQGAPVGLPKRKYSSIEPRHVIVLACFLATLCMYMERVGFSIAFTELAKTAALDESIKGTVLSAFFWGYALSQVPGGWAAQKYGGRIMLAFSFALWSTVSMLTPTDASHVALIVPVRVAIGVAQGFLIPAVHTVLSQWIPPHERAKAVSLATSGMYLGSAAAMWVLPSVAAMFGASSLLKVDGGIGYCWLAMWMLVGKDVPHRETVIPLSTNDAAAGKGSQKGSLKGSQTATPWRRMMASPAVWAIVVSNFSFHYAVYVIMNWLPTYFNSVLKVELASLGTMKTLPYVTMFLMSNVGGWAGDYCINRLKMKPGTRATRANAAEAEMDAEVNAAAMLVILESLDESIQIVMMEEKTAFSMWAAVIEMMTANDAANRMSLVDDMIGSELTHGESATEYINRVHVMSKRLANAGVKLDPVLLVSMVLRGLPEPYSPFKVAMRASQTADYSLQTLNLLLTRAEADIQLAAKESDRPIKFGTAMAVVHGRPGKQPSWEKGSGRQQQGGGSRPFQGVCHRCKQPGHIAAECMAERPATAPVGGAACVAFDKTIGTYFAL